MKKILVFICLMVLSSSVFSFSLTIERYKEAKEFALTSKDKKEFEAYLKGIIKGSYDGLTYFNFLSDHNMNKYGTKLNFELWCEPDKLTLNYENLIDIIDGELERGEDLDQFPITFILYDGLLKTFPCE